MATIIHLSSQKPIIPKRPSGSKGKVLRFPVRYLAPEECLGLGKPESIVQYGNPESKKEPLSECENVNHDSENN
jgi:hypothetical protein